MPQNPGLASFALIKPDLEPRFSSSPFRHNSYRGGAGARADHRAEKLAAFVLCAVGFVDKVVDRLSDLLSDLRIDCREFHFLRHTGGGDSACLLPHCSLVPARLLPVVAAYVEGVADCDGPNP